MSVWISFLRKLFPLKLRVPISAPSGSPSRHEIVVLKKDMRSVTPMICSSSLSREKSS